MAMSNMGAAESAEIMVFSGPYIHSTGLENLTIVEDGVLIVKYGKIAAVDRYANLHILMGQFGFNEDTVKYLKKGEFLMPGMIDTHIHAPQYPNAGLGMDKTLLDWLNEYTYPLESKFSSADLARYVYQKVVRRTLRNGTTTASYFATIHTESSCILADIAESEGQRAFVGKLNMNVNAPEYYIETTDDSVRDTETFLQTMQAKKSDLVKPVITPRFALSCDGELLSRLGDLAEEYDVNIQSHICENVDEIRAVLELHSSYDTYAGVYYNNKLLNEKTVMAHGVYLTDKDIELFLKSKASVAHCPSSNTNIRSGLCDVRRLLDDGVNVSLGTDISGGYSHSILDAIRKTTEVSNILSLSKPESYKRVTYKEAFYMATMAGAKALAIDKIVGNFEIGKEFDALWIDVNSADSGMDSFENHVLEEHLQTFLYRGDDRNIKAIYVAGKEVLAKKDSQ